MKRTLLSLIAILAITMGSFAQSMYWNKQNSGMAESRGLQDLMAVDANIVWGAAYDGVTPTNPCVNITRTSDGGTTWIPKTINGAASVCIANICGIDANKAWAITYYPTGTGANDGVYYTADGGTTWTHQTTAAFSNSASSGVM